MENANPLISIIIPVYNVEKYIEKCALSLINQTYKNCEFIFVNDGTQDNSVGVLKTINDNRIKIINQQNQGVSSARNKGIESAKGEYIIFVDADDYVADDYVEYLYELITTNNADFAYSTKLFQSKNDKQIENDFIRVVDGAMSAAILLSPDVVVGSYNKIYKKDIINNNNLTFKTDLFYGEGLNFIIRMSLSSNRVAIGEKRILYYRKNNLSSVTTKYNIDKYHNGLKSLDIISNLIDLKDNFTNSMYTLHLTNYYLNAVTQMIEYKKVKEYKNYYKAWRKNIKNNLLYILKNKYVSKYRKCMIFAGAFFPHIIALLDIKRRKRIIENSID